MMENVVAERVRNATLTKSQQKIAEHIIRNVQRVGSMTSLELAGEIGVSDASIIRFARAIGYDGYADMKEDVYSMLAQNAFGGLSLTERLSRNTEKYGGTGSPAEFLDLMQSNLDSVFRNNDPELFVQSAEQLIQAEHRYVIGQRGCKGTATQFARLLSFMLPRVHVLLDGECQQIHALQDAGPEDAAMMFVFSRFYRVDLNYASLARDRGVKLTLITNVLSGPLTPYADTIIHIDTENMSFFHSTIAGDMAGEYLLKLISDRVDYKERIEEVDEITEPERL